MGTADAGRLSGRSGLDRGTQEREALRAAFKRFDPEKVARITDRDVQRLLKDEGIIRSRAKIEATIAGARILLQMRKDGEDFAGWIWRLAGGKPIQRQGAVAAQTPLSVEISKALKKRGFKFVGPVIVYAWMQAAGIVNDHAPHCFRRADRAEVALKAGQFACAGFALVRRPAARTIQAQYFPGRIR